MGTTEPKDTDVLASVLIKCAGRSALEIARQIREMGFDAFGVAGMWDVLANISATDRKALGRIVIDRIQGISGVEETLTLFRIE